MGHKFISQKKQSKEEMFDALVKNAIDFLDASLDDLDKRPKNSIVDFYSSIELFLKARLMNEHWTLILSRPELANLDSFQVGDFHSVFLDDAVKRMKNILRDPLPAKAVDVFKALGEHRNQIVHFAHTNYQDIDATKVSVVVEQWSAWHYLHELIVTTWSPIFDGYLEEIKRIHNRMMGQQEFIAARFAEITPAIEIKKISGKKIEVCSHCNMASAEITKQNSWGNEYQCLVCGVKDVFIAPTTATIPCHHCNKDIEFFNKNFKSCPHCHKEIEHEHVLKACREKYSDGDGWCDEGAEWVAYCHECHDDEPSVFYIDGCWSCITCFDRGWQAISCPHCVEFVTGDMETIKHFACVRCEDDARAALAEDGF
ncbi:hypothetical protein [Vibrio metschnikovii]|uniref:hypothetical protein n=2 Tax=Bacteria TaxID=2 RepID=UPI001C30BF1A|nr:hypothetical protein [Vibrio metschnikovii]